MKILLATISLCLLCNYSYAGPFSRRNNYRYQNKTYSYTSNSTFINGSDQERCQAEANFMAANNITEHVGNTIGRFEGVGYGNSPNCETCSPGNSMRLTGDASAQGRNGMWYRVRSWR